MTSTVPLVGLYAQDGILGRGGSRGASLFQGWFGERGNVWVENQHFSLMGFFFFL